MTSNEGENDAKDDNFIRGPGNESFKEPTKDFVQARDIRQPPVNLDAEVENNEMNEKDKSKEA